jgi:hypothetical protein
MPELKPLYPDLSPEELEEAKENLRQYLLIAWEIWESQHKQEAEASRAPLTQEALGSTIKAKVDSPNNYLPKL